MSKLRKFIIAGFKASDYTTKKSFAESLDLNPSTVENWLKESKSDDPPKSAIEKIFEMLSPKDFSANQQFASFELLRTMQNSEDFNEKFL